MAGPITILGPQRPEPNLPDALAEIPGEGPVVLISAGWRHEESDLETPEQVVGPALTLLPLYAWFEELLRQAPELTGAHHAHQESIRRLKKLYRLRLQPALETVRRLRSTAGDDDLARPELEDALEGVRHLDRRFVARCDALHASFRHTHQPLEHPLVRKRHEQAAAVLNGARAVLIAGGHIGVLRNRLEFFGLGALLRSARGDGTAIVGWSAGAMVLTERVVLFHDDPADGFRDAEVLDRGLGLIPDLVLLPHARERLALDDRARVALLAGRFLPHQAVGLENGAWLEVRDRAVRVRGTPEGAFVLGADGLIGPLEGGDAQRP